MSEENGKRRMAGNRVNKLKERLGDEYDRISAPGLQGGITTPGIDSSTDKYSAAEIYAELRNRGDKTVNDGENSMKNYFQGLVGEGSKFNDKARGVLEGIGVDFSGYGGGGGEKKDPVATTPETRGRRREQAPKVGPTVTIPDYESPYKPSPTPGGGGSGGLGDFIVGRDLNQSVGKSGDMETNITGSTFGDNAVIGNDNSVTSGSNSAGNSMFGSALDLRRQSKARAGAFGGGLRLS